MNRFILTEDERRNISKLHKSYITEQAVQDVAVQPGVYNEKVKQLQDHLNTKFQSGLVADGKLGPKTLAAAQAALTKAASDNSKTVVDGLPIKPLQPLETGIKTPEIIQNTNTSSAPDADNEAKPLNT
jgi:peptidoglycan hydrolase-like protein with peptidoglycan-binding domain